MKGYKGIVLVARYTIPFVKKVLDLSGAYRLHTIDW